MTIRRAAERLHELGAVPVLVAALLLAASSAWAGGHQDRSGGHSGGSGGGGGHYAVPSGGGHSGSSSGSSHSGSSGSSSGTSSSSDHSAVPIGSSNAHHGPNRQPPTRHGGGFHGGFHGRGFYPGYGFGYWPGFFWGWYWDDYWGYGYPYGYPYHYGYGYGYPGGYGHYDRYSRDEMGALDLDISPGDTEVWLDGEKIGTVDDFDGWPQYLWLPKGTYDLVFYHPGYKTLARQVSVYPGLVVDMDDQLEKGEAILPKDLQTKTHERRDDRLRYERERSDRIDRGEWDSRRRDDDNWRDRAPRHKAEREDGRTADAGWLRLDVDPEDASVYLDGRFVGTGTELSHMQHGLRVEPGEHHLAVVRPGRKSDERDFKVAAGEEVKVSVDLGK